MKKSKFNITIKILSIILSVLMVYILISMVVHRKSTQAFISLPTNKVDISNNKDWSEQINKLQNKLKQDASINVLEGAINIEKTYENKDAVKGGKLVFLREKLAELKSRTLYITTEYKYGYAFNLSDMRISDLGDGNIQIDLSKNDLYIKYLEELSANRQIKDEYGLLAKDFSPQETATILELTKISVFNTIQNSSEIRDKASAYAKTNVENISKSFGFTSVKVEIIDDGLIDNTEVVIKDINNK